MKEKQERAKTFDTSITNNMIDKLDLGNEFEF